MSEQGDCYLSPSADRDKITNLKLPFILDEITDEDVDAVTAFLALTLKHTRNWTMANTHFGKVKLNWLINVGLPAASFDNTNLITLYKNMVHNAWVLSQAATISLSAAKKLRLERLASINSARRLHLGAVEIFPEFLAQIVGYVQSPSRRPYSHVLVDIGAGTLDIVFFTVERVTGLWRFKTFSQQVKPLGVDMFFQHRLNAAKTSASLDNTKFPSDKEFCRLFKVSKNQLKALDVRFLQQVCRILKEVLYESDSSYLGGIKGSPQGWTNSTITTFLCGGGAMIPQYRSMLDHVPERYPLELMPMPRPQRLKNKKLTPAIFSRLSVAYGLSFDAFNIGEMVKASKDAKADEVNTDHFAPSEYLMSS
ncbi:MAG: hypothetical protein ACRCZA_15700 [Shewanella sp.]|uniref:hypothetical protein n=1 Tax=Shewanella sp. TaxID=50422 RepID=UPI003F3362AB